MPLPSNTFIVLPYDQTADLGAPSWFSFTLAAPATVTVSTMLSEGARDTVLALYNGAGNFLAFNDDFGGTPESEITLALGAGTFYIAAAGYASGIVTGDDWTFTGSLSIGIIRLTATSSEGASAPAPAPAPGPAPPPPAPAPAPAPGQMPSAPSPTSSDLQKIINQRFSEGSEGQAGFPGQPYLPARTVLQSVEVCGYVQLTPAEVIAESGYNLTYGVVGQDSYGNDLYGYIGSGGQSLNIPTSVYRCRIEQQLVNLPEQSALPPTAPIPPSPGGTIYDFQLGWNARAHSRVSMPRDGRYSFRIPFGTTGVVVGLTKAPQPSGFSDILWGFYVSYGAVYIYERGVEVANLGTHPNAYLSVERTVNRIKYRLDGEVVRDVPNNSGPMLLGAALYTGGDEVQDAEFEELYDGYGEGTFAPMAAVGGDVAYAIGEGTFSGMVGVAYALATGSGAGVFAPMQGFAADASGYAIGIGTLSAMTGEADGTDPELVPSYSLAAGTFPPMIGIASGLTGTVGQGVGTFSSMAGIGSELAYAQGAGTFSAMTSYGENLGAEDEATVVSVMIAQMPQDARVLLFVVMNSNMEVESLLTVSVEMLADLMNSMGLAADFDLEAEIEALLQSVMTARATTPAPGDTATVYSLDVGGSTRYTNYAFNSFAQFDGAHYGAKADGIYLLQGSTDDGDFINASVNLGRPNMGSFNRKGLPYVYVGAASSGVLILKVVADGQEYFYRASSSGTDVATHRFTPGLGLRATNYELEIQNESGDAFDLAEIEFVPVQLSRRI